MRVCDREGVSGERALSNEKEREKERKRGR